MVRLPDPIREVLRTDGDEMLRLRVERGLRHRRRAPSSRRVGLPWVWAAAGFVAAAVLFAFGLEFGSEHGRESNVLRFDDGRHLFALQGSSTEAVRQVFSDGSTVRLSPRGLLIPLATQPRTAFFLLERGEAHFAVSPDQGYRWSVECDRVTIESVGSRFSVEKTRSWVMIRVKQGEVLVRGAWISNRIRRLTAGESMTFPAGAPPRTESAENSTNDRSPSAPRVDDRMQPSLPDASLSTPSAGDEDFR